MYLIEKLKMSIMEILMRKQDYAQQVRTINSNDGYFNRFYQLVGECSKHEEAWQKLEDERLDLGLNEKYSTYNSFRKAKKAYMDIRFV
jgi:hypothetical protein